MTPEQREASLVYRHPAHEKVHDPLKLWEHDHDGRPCPFARDEQHFENWPALRDNADHHDDDLNVVIWWDWWPPDVEADHDRLTLYVAMPNRERVYPWTATVTRDQEPEIREWLRGRLDRLVGYWQINGPMSKT